MENHPSSSTSVSFFSTPHPRPIEKVVKDPVTKNILILGSTQNGKSTLCNFLVLNEMDYNPIFEIGTGMQSKTKALQERIVQFENVNQICETEILKTTASIRIIDTPGAGDTEANEEQNILRLYAKILEMHENKEVLSGVILCYRFGNLVNDVYKENIRFYKKVLCEVFQQNVIIVITDVQRHNPIWVRTKEKSGQNIDAQLDDFKTILVRELEINPTTPAFEIDGMPMIEKQFKHSTNIRTRIFQKCMDTKISPSKFHFAKIPTMKRYDDQIINKLNGEIAGIQTGIHIANKSLSQVTATINSLNNQLCKKLTQKKNLDSRIEGMDNDSRFALVNLVGTDSWHFHKRAEYPYNYQSSYPIIDYTVTLGWLKKEIEELHHIKGAVKNTYLRKLSTILTVYTTNKDFYAEYIQNMKHELAIVQNEIKVQQDELTAYESQQLKSNQDLKEYIDQERQIRDNIAELSKEYLTIEEVRKLKLLYNLD